MWDATTKTGHLLPYDLEIPWYDGDVLFEMSVDWHPAKPPGVLWSFEYLAGPNKGDVIFFDEISPNEGKTKTISDIAQMIREHENFRNTRLRRWCDPKMKDKNNALISGFSAYDEFRHCGISLSPANNRNPETGIAIVNDYLRGKSQTKKEHPRMFIVETCRTLRHHMKNHFWKKKEDGTGIPDPKFSDYCINVRYHLQPKSRRIDKSVENRGNRFEWPLTSYGNKMSRNGVPTSSQLQRYMRGA